MAQQNAKRLIAEGKMGGSVRNFAFQTAIVVVVCLLIYRSFFRTSTPAALPAIALKERGYNGIQYQGHAVLNADFLRIGGKALEGTFLPTGAMLIPEQLDDSNPIKKVALDYVTKYEAQFGAGTRATFGGHAYDAFLVAANAIPAALKVAKPGTPEFRKALREEIEKSKDVVGTHGVFNLTPTDHIGLDNRARMIVRGQDGTWKLVK